MVAANWKMNGSRQANDGWLTRFSARAAALHCEVVVCAPYVYLEQLRVGLSRSQIGAQDLSAQPPGAFTGDIAAEMLRDVGCAWVLVGHSERRQWHGETDAEVAAKAARAVQLGLRPIVCVGETLQQREAGHTFTVLSSQLSAVLDAVGAEGLASGALAYEPVWAIGTGQTASPQQAQEVHAALRAHVSDRDRKAGQSLRILYGGSVKPGNAKDLFAQSDIDGGLIGGASLLADDFVAICSAASS
ncbi:MAG: triose-phosphate isomerase [Burkholderiaceae bacterium]|nr:triose-phosphate isomerase [Burkholderiaceae bacterium]